MIPLLLPLSSLSFLCTAPHVLQTDSLKYPRIGVTETPCDERRDAFLRWCSSHGVANLSYGKDRIIIDTTPCSHQEDVWESFTWGQNPDSSSLPSREPINGSPYHTSQELLLVCLPFLARLATHKELVCNKQSLCHYLCIFGRKCHRYRPK